MNLMFAMMCLDCEEIYSCQDNHTACPMCGSQSAASLSKWLNPSPDKIVAAMADRTTIKEGV
jgi:hypothetical protein